MEKNRKNLKSYSIVVLLFVALELIKGIVSLCIVGIPQPTDVPEGLTIELIRIINMIAVVLVFVMLLPQLYIGVKGIKVANNPEVGGKAHIVWGIILAVFAAISTISSVSDVLKVFSVTNLINAMIPVLDLIVFICYVIYARRVANAQ